MNPCQLFRLNSSWKNFMTVIVSGHFIYRGRVGGAEHMTYNLVRGMDAAGTEISFICSSRNNLAPEFVLESATTCRRIIECGGSGSRFLAEQIACLDYRISGNSILFPNYYVPPLVPSRLGHVAVVIHDFQYRHYPEFFSAKKRAWLRLAHTWAFERADTVILISDFVRRDAIRLYGSRAERSVVIPNPVSWDHFGSIRGKHPFGGRPYILSVAAHYAHKRLDVLIKAFEILSAKHPDLLLVLTGQLAANLVGVKFGRVRLLELIKTLGISERIRVMGYVEPLKLGDVYHHAAAFAFPSVFEGFGMPAVEALGFGIPTLATRCTAIPEITLGLASYVKDAGDVNEWADRLRVMIEAPRLPTKAVDSIRQKYNPPSIAEKYLEVMAK
jgi:glycosyltransferase involved in cell wall biosynthesis